MIFEVFYFCQKMSLQLYQTVNFYLTDDDLKYIKETVNEGEIPRDYKFIRDLIKNNGGDLKNIWTREHVMDFFKGLREKKELEQATQEEYEKEWKDDYEWDIDEYKSGNTVHSQIVPTENRKQQLINDWRHQISVYKKTDRQKQIAKLERELEQKRRELTKLRQEEKEWQEEYAKEWKDLTWDEPVFGNTVNSKISPMDKLMTELYRNPFGTKIAFNEFTTKEHEELGRRLRDWYHSQIESKRELEDRIFVEFWLLNGSHIMRPLFRCDEQLNKMFEGDYTFSVDNMDDNISSDQTVPIYISMFTSMTFHLKEKPAKGYFRDDHESGFFPYRLREEFKEFAPILEPYQIYYRMNQSAKSKTEALENCFIHVCKQCGVDNETAYNIAKFTDDRRYIDVKVLTHITEKFPQVCFKVRKIDNRGKIQIMNEKNKHMYGTQKEDSIVVEICEFQKHFFKFDTNVPVNLFYIKNFAKVNEYGDKKGWTFEDKCKASKFRANGVPRTDISKCKCDSFRLITTLMDAGAFEPIKACDEDFKSLEINMRYLDQKYDDIIAKPEVDRDVKIIADEKGPRKKTYLNSNIFYADFETCKRSNDKGGFYAFEFMLCVQSMNGSRKETFVGSDCGEQMCKYLPNHSLVYFHNLGFDGRLLMKCGVSNMIRKGSKIMSMTVTYNDKQIELRDSYSMLSQPLATFPSAFPKAFAGTNIHKELFPYDYYTYERVYTNGKSIGNIKEAIEIAHWNEQQAETFLHNLEITGSKLSDDTFDMIKYCEFYCQQDVNVLRIGFNAFHDAALDDPINLNVFEFLTAASLAGEYMDRNVFKPNGNIYKISGNLQKFIQKCVYGGRCMTRDNKCWHVMDKLDDFDACSLYPSAMARLFTVEGVPEYYDFSKEIENVYSKDNLPWIIQHAFDEDQTEPTAEKYISQFFIHIAIKKVGIDRHFPLIVKRANGKQTNCNECVEMYVDMITLQDLIKYQQIEFTIIEGYIMKGKRDHRIRKAITSLFEKRAEFKRTGNPVQQIIKLIMNSAYGKTIQKPIKSTVTYANEEKMNWLFWHKYNSIIESTQIPNTNIWYIEKMRREDSQFNNAIFGVSVLSMSKRIMNEVMCLAEDLNIKIYYQDTDSMHIEHDKLHILAEEFKKIYGRELIGENKIGCFHNDFDELKDAYCVEHISCGKKIYCDVLANDKGESALHYRMKGAPQRSIQIAANENYDGDIVKLYSDMNKGQEITIDLLKGGCIFKMDKYGNIEYNKGMFRKIKATC